MEESIFTKIVKGEIPAHKIYENERVLAFLDIHPLTAGHTLVIPKHQIEFVWDLDDEDYQAVMAAAKAIARRMRDVLGVKYVGVKVIGVDVPHAHVQLVPFNSAAEYTASQDMEREPDHAGLAAIAEKLRL
jgi:histidine triad (HIT) family protein